MTTPQLTRTSEDSANAEASALNEARLRLIIDAVPGLVSYVDSDLRYRIANQTYMEWFGLDVSDLIGRSMQEMMGRVGFKAIRPHIERAFQGEIVTFEESLLYRDGKHRDVRATYIPDRGLTEFVQGLIVLIADITEEKKLREATLHLAAIVQSSEDAIISKDLNGTSQAGIKQPRHSSATLQGKPSGSRLRCWRCQIALTKCPPFWTAFAGATVWNTSRLSAATKTEREFRFH